MTDDPLLHQPPEVVAEITKIVDDERRKISIRYGIRLSNQKTDYVVNTLTFCLYTFFGTLAIATSIFAIIIRNKGI